MDMEGEGYHPQFHNQIEIDWRELDPFYTELQECASFWTLINLATDMVYSGLVILSVFLKSDVDSPLFEGMHSHANPILMYLIISLIVNYGALRSNQANYEGCFFVFSIIKGLLFPLTLGTFLYLLLLDVQEYFGDFWMSFLIILACYNGTAALGLWSMYICNKYIYVNEAAQNRSREVKLRRQQIGLLEGEELEFCSCCSCDKCEINKSFAMDDTDAYPSECTSSTDEYDHHQQQYQERHQRQWQYPIRDKFHLWTIHQGFNELIRSEIEKEEGKFLKSQGGRGDEGTNDNISSKNGSSNGDEVLRRTAIQDRYRQRMEFQRFIFGSIDDISNVQITL